MSDPFETVRSWMPGQGHRPLTEEEQWAVEDIQDAALAFEAGEALLAEAMKIGAISRGDEPPSPRYGRMVAMIHTPIGDPKRKAIIKLCTAADKMQGANYTKHGRFTSQEIVQNNSDVRWMIDNGHAHKGIR